MLILDDVNLKELITYLKGQDYECVKAFTERMIEVNKKARFYIPWTHEEEQEITHKMDIRIARNEGSERATIETVKNMAKMNFSPKVISKCVGLSLAKVNKIISSIVL